jgi:hypothetical protein
VLARVALSCDIDTENVPPDVCKGEATTLGVSTTKLLLTAVEEAEGVYTLSVLTGATSILEADTEEVASGIPLGDTIKLLVTADELPWTLEDTEDEEVVEMLTGVTFTLDTDAEEKATGVSRGEATRLDILAEILLDRH